MVFWVLDKTAGFRLLRALIKTIIFGKLATFDAFWWFWWFLSGLEV